MTDLSIIVVNYNTKDLLVDCIDSIKKEGSNLKKEIIVIDNASQDDSKAYLESTQFKKSGKNLKTKTILNKKNLGFSKANNKGIKIAKGKYILLLNSDTKVKKGALDELIKFVWQTTEAGVVGPRLLNPDGSVQGSCFNFPSLQNAIREYFLGPKGAFGKYAPKENYPIVVDAVVGAAFLITPQALQNVGLLDEKYFFYYEDLDYCRRVKKQGMKVYYLPSSQIIHYHGAAGKTNKDVKVSELLVDSSKKYHGIIGYYILTFILKIGQKWKKLMK